MAAALTLGGCANVPPADDLYPTAFVVCMAAFDKAPKTAALSDDAFGACQKSEAEKGRDAFSTFWTTPSEWEPYMDNVYRIEKLL